MGKIREDNIECSYHGLQFNSKGRCAFNPHSDIIPERANIHAYPVQERHNLIWIWPGNSDLANEDLIPDYSHLTAPAHKTIEGYMLAQANYQLLVDNLLDLSHAQYLHLDYFEGSTFLKADVSLEKKGQRMIQRYECPPADASAVKGADLAQLTGQLCQTIHVYWQAPGFVRNETGARPVNAMQNRIIFNIGSHLLTPETEYSTHYFYAGTRSYGLENENIDEGIRDWHQTGFGEQDKPMIEAVQRVMGSDLDLRAHKPVLLSIDKAAMQARSIISDLIKSEQESENQQFINSV